jgi:hypothetical protein
MVHEPRPFHKYNSVAKMFFCIKWSRLVEKMNQSGLPMRKNKMAAITIQKPDKMSGIGMFQVLRSPL